jgi:hypothetical protein
VGETKGGERELDRVFFPSLHCTHLLNLSARLSCNVRPPLHSSNPPSLSRVERGRRDRDEREEEVEEEKGNCARQSDKEREARSKIQGEVQCAV